MSLQGKRIIVLGGTSGIGLATAVEAAAGGAHVTVVSSKADKVANALQKLPAGSEGFALDLSRESNIAEFFRTAGTFDHLVYTAADSLKLDVLANTDLQASRDFLTLRFWGALTAVKYASIHPGGSIGLMGGIASARPGKGWAMAAAVCGAMEGLTRALAVELAPVRVNLVAPGVIRTPLWSGTPDSFFTETAARLPVGRVGEAEDVAAGFMFLMQQPFTTGQVLTIDGGTVLV
ncbi:SDR family oxidoreductase [Dinghuibacter silviterrae]|uniref:NAD(P)-dependent dehydrogenase (Short-subunit alcohol dehydrogenase family) n=1 Tax=Dinghuibacter silviterrae TaxID=1539049 RepID=A0A4R8DY59_9BACT|nr:SDR family oxidoreductase [Dinghuibacter silviterrae]TDX02387.1 NAD(P)-dependent dehydrogenase (short-subunit alcohol dehydrogenase family) [Dinghuibacter silviterrae]